jgi:NAD-dependent dihydropyrimidine dehydrogenase PreA subunit
MEGNNWRSAVSEVKFNVFSGGSVTIDHTRCVNCKTKVCVDVCQTVGNGLILGLNEDGLPHLIVDEAQVARGACVEDMGCLLACQIDGENAIRFDLNMEEFEAALKEQGEKPVYARSLRENG